MGVYKIPVSWEEYGYIIVEAESEDEAFSIVEEHEDEYELPYEHYYIDGSFRIEYDGGAICLD